MPTSKQADTTTLLSDIVAALNSSSVHVRCGAVDAMLAMKERVPSLIEPLIRALGDESEEVRARAVTALGYHGKDSPEVASALMPMLHDDSVDKRLEAAKILLRIGRAPESDSAVLCIAREFQDHYWWSAMRVIEGPQAKGLQPFLMGIIKELRNCVGRNDKDVRHDIHRADTALYALMATRPTAQEVALELSQLVSTCLAQRITDILKEIGITKACVPHLAAALQWDPPEALAASDPYGWGNSFSGDMIAAFLHRSVSELLATLGPDAAEAIPALEVVSQLPISEVGIQFATSYEAAQDAQKKRPCRWTTEQGRNAALEALTKIRGELGEHKVSSPKKKTGSPKRKRKEVQK